MTHPVAIEMPSTKPHWWSVFIAFLRLGLTSFGGPVAHLGYFQKEFVEKRKWLDSTRYADLVALCQFLPGPASSQVGIALGLSRAGISGAIAAFLGFTLPSAMAMCVFALMYDDLGNALGAEFLQGFKLVSVAVVAQALWSMGKNFSRGTIRTIITLISAIAVMMLPPTIGQILVIIVAGLVGIACLRTENSSPIHAEDTNVSKRTAITALILFFVLLAGLPLLANTLQLYPVTLFDSFYRTGALVFGGGHVVLPLLESQAVQSGWVSQEAFLAGYGATQAMPGPLFTFAAFLGAISTQTPSGWIGASIALLAIFLPAFLLVIGALPFWERWRHQQVLRNALLGINAGVVGLLLAAFYHPVWTSAIHRPTDLLVAMAALMLLIIAKLPAWLVVLLTVLFSGFFLS
ncbi:chromate efflux transporter [Undibacterium sp. RuRC25W]|uniref:chromate efflux transporter n=1 Tax=Undibacterium sp. RuRC25W TaxID=3413047 RepID=UPI003BF13D91